MICGPALLNAFWSLSNHLKRILKPKLAWMLCNNTQDPGLFPRILFWFPSKFGHAWEFAEDGTWTSDFLNVTLGSMAFVCPRVLGLWFLDILKSLLTWCSGSHGTGCRQEGKFVTWLWKAKILRDNILLQILSYIPGHADIVVGGSSSL